MNIRALRVLFVLSFTFILVFTCRLSAQQWQTIGPYGGLGRTVVVDSTKGVFYAGVGTEVYRSHDGGYQWERLPITNDPLAIPTAFGTVQSLLLDGERLYAIPQFGSVTVSSDGGETWEALAPVFNRPEGYSQGNLSLTVLHDTIYMRVTGNSAAGYYPYFASADDGKTWFVADTVPFTAPFFYTDGRNLYSYGSQGLYKRIASKQWEQYGPDNVSVWKVVSWNGNMFLLAESGLYRTTDDGESWQKIKGEERIGTNFGMVVYHDTLLTSMAEGLFYLPPGGDSLFFDLSYQLPAFPPNAMAVYNNQLVAVFDRGGYRWDTTARQWQVSHKGWESQVVSIIRNYNGILFAGTQNGLHRLEDEELGWEQSDLLSGLPIASIDSANGKVYAISRYSNAIFSSSDSGRSWKSTPISSLRSFYPEAFAAAGTTLLIISPSAGIFRSTDEGLTWTRTRQVVANGIIPNSIAANDEVIIATPTSGNLLRSTDQGLTWQVSAPDIRYESGQMIKESDGIFYLLEVGGSLYRSEDNGENWLEISKPLPYGLSLQGEKTQRLWSVDVFGDTLFVSLTDTSNSSYFYYASVDGGETWRRLITHDIWTPTAIALDGEKILVGTYGRGIIRSQFATSDVRESLVHLPVALAFNTQTNTLNYTLEKPAHVQCMLYSVSGELVGSLLNTEQEAGEHSIYIHPEKLTSGTYLLVLLNSEGKTLGATHITSVQ